MSQFSAQETVHFLAHNLYFGVVAQEVETCAAALHLLQHGQHTGILNGGIQFDEEDELKVAAGHRTGLQFRHVDIQSCQLGKNLIQSTGLVFKGQDEADAVGTGIDHGIFGNADKTSVVVVAVLNLIVDALQSVQCGTGMRRNGGGMAVSTLSNHFCGHGGIVAGNHTHAV